jgi:hypothetical protein
MSLPGETVIAEGDCSINLAPLAAAISAHVTWRSRDSSAGRVQDPDVGLELTWDKSPNAHPFGVWAVSKFDEVTYRRHDELRIGDGIKLRRRWHMGMMTILLVARSVAGRIEASAGWVAPAPVGVTWKCHSYLMDATVIEKGNRGRALPWPL